MTILNTITHDWGLIRYIIICAILGVAIITVITSLIDLIAEHITGDFIFVRLKMYNVVVTIIIFVGLIIGGAVGYSTYPGPETKYEIILDDTYPASKLLKGYEILEKRGDIYTVKLLEDE